MNKLHTIIAGIALLFGFTTTSHGQSFEFAQDSASLSGEAGTIIKVENNITNLNEDTVEFRWVRAESNLPSGWQKCGVCDNNKCYNDADSATFVLYPSGDGNMSINFYAFDDEGNPVEGTGSLTVEVYPVDSGRSHAQQTFFKASTHSTSIDDNEKEANIKFYPNPAQDILNLQTKSTGLHEVMIYNSAGAQVQSTTFTGKGTNEININALKPGTYFLQYQSPNGKHATQSFIKE